jgi:hypothetical protein
MRLRWLGIWARKNRKRFFLKKEAKTFANGAVQRQRRMRRAAGPVAKVFWFFFSKKNFSYGTV